MKRPNYLYLTDLIRSVGGWPIDLSRVAVCLDLADVHLKQQGGRDSTAPLTRLQLKAMGFSDDGSESFDYPEERAETR